MKPVQLKCMPVVAQEETKEEFLLKKLEEYDFEEKEKEKLRKIIWTRKI